MRHIVYIILLLMLVFSGCTNTSKINDLKVDKIDNEPVDTDVSIEVEKNEDSEEFVLMPPDEEIILPKISESEELSNFKNTNQNKKLPFPSISKFTYDFSKNMTIEESGEVTESYDPDWSVSSGAYLFIENGIGKTIQGELLDTDKWFSLYRQANFEDTDGGKHPQNIFRFVLLKKFLNFSQEAYFRIKNDNLSDSPFRNGSNGLLFFNRYQSSETLYYTGIRVDGGVTIKKKKDGIYYTLKTESVFPGDYNRETNPNLLPKEIWLGLKSVVMNREDGGVEIKVYLDEKLAGEWKLICEAIDDGKTYGGEVLQETGLAGIRTDFMDVEFDNYSIEEINL